MKTKLNLFFFVILFHLPMFNFANFNPMEVISVTPIPEFQNADYTPDYILQHYSLPNDHPIKPALDEIFSSSTILSSLDELKSAGFIQPKIRKREIIIGKHPDLKGYLLKFYLDSSQKNCFQNFTQRIRGALLAQNAIDQYGYGHILNVPRKWIYQIPDKSTDKNKYVLVVDDMQLVSSDENTKFYIKKVSKEQIQALFNVIVSCGLQDSPSIHNIPYTKSGFISFIDTELESRFVKTKAVIRKMKISLSPRNAAYWEELCQIHIGPE